MKSLLSTGPLSFNLLLPVGLFSFLMKSFVVCCSINFLANYQIDPSILNEFDIISYVSTITTLVLASGLLFQLPMVIFFLTKAGIVNKTILRSYRKHAIVIILVFGAMLTPPDPFSQIVMAVPLVGLYEISILISGNVKRK